MRTTQPEIQIVGITRFIQPEGVPWTTDAEGGQALAEFAGRACYQSWKKPNPKTGTNRGYLDHIKEVGHLSVLEHGTVSMYFTGISRSFTHELVRHRHFSYSQLSQRYVPEQDAAMIEPAVIASDNELHHLWEEACQKSLDAYAALVGKLEERFADETDLTPTEQRKAARQAARSVLPNATETRIVVTGNYRAWRHFLDTRATRHADVEIREVALEVWGQLNRVAPHVFNDYKVVELPDNTFALHSPYSEVS